MKYSIHYFFIVLLLFVIKLRCMEKNAAPVMVALRQSKGMIRSPGDGHKTTAHQKIVRSQSEEALGVLQQQEGIEVSKFTGVTIKKGPIYAENSVKGIRISVSPKGSIIPRPSRLSKELIPGIDFILEETETDDSEGSPSSVVTPEATTAEKT